MKIEIDPNRNELRIRGKGNRSLRIHMSERDGADVISFEVCDGTTCRGGDLPDVEFTERDTLLRHIGNRLEQVS